MQYLILACVLLGSAYMYMREDNSLETLIKQHNFLTTSYAVNELIIDEDGIVVAGTKENKTANPLSHQAFISKYTQKGKFLWNYDITDDARAYTVHEGTVRLSDSTYYSYYENEKYEQAATHLGAHGELIANHHYPQLNILAAWASKNIYISGMRNNHCLIARLDKDLHVINPKIILSEQVVNSKLTAVNDTLLACYLQTKNGSLLNFSNPYSNYKYSYYLPVSKQHEIQKIVAFANHVYCLFNYPDGQNSSLVIKINSQNGQMEKQMLKIAYTSMLIQDDYYIYANENQIDTYDKHGKLINCGELDKMAKLYGGKTIQARGETVYAAGTVIKDWQAFLIISKIKTGKQNSRPPKL